MQMSDILLQNYLPYAKDVIMNRAIPAIDGLKPVQRRILYTMYQMKLLNGDRTKSANIVGSTMHLHPHGDSAIYDALVRLTESNESLNVPYIDGKGNFGKVYSDDIRPAASRYTEAKLAAICNEMFDGIDENAVNMLSSYDNSTTEPELLPVKFPTVLVNTSSGIAVAMSSNIPSFALKNVCEGTKGVLDGSIKNSHELMDVLGTPEFSTGGVLYATKSDLYNLGDTGRQGFTISGKCDLYSNKIVITEIPYNTVASDIVDAINEHIKDKSLNEVADVNDLTDKDGFKIEIDLKRGANSRDVLRKIIRMTKFHTGISFNTRCIIENSCVEIGVYDLLMKWIDFRRETIKRIHKFRFDKNVRQEHQLESWEKIQMDIQEVARLIANKNESGAKQALMDNWALTDDQADYILDMRIRMFTQDNLKKKLKELADVRADKKYNDSVVNDDREKDKIIIADMDRIIKKYGVDRKTSTAAPLPTSVFEEEKHVANSEPVDVYLTKKGYLKRAGVLDGARFNMEPGDEIIRTFKTCNNEYLLVFTWNGECHKILVDDIDMSRAKPRDTLAQMAEIQNNEDAMYIVASGDFTGHFNLVYKNGRGTRVTFDRFKGRRKKYISVYDPCEKGWDCPTPYDKFFVVTRSRTSVKAAYVDLGRLDLIQGRCAFKAARMTGERIIGIVPAAGVPYPEMIDFARYSKGYTVKIGYDELWGKRLSTKDFQVKYTKIAIKEMLTKSKYNEVSFELAGFYNPAVLSKADVEELGLEMNDNGEILLPPLNEGEDSVKLITADELKNAGVVGTKSLPSDATAKSSDAASNDTEQVESETSQSN